jgi:hypothetical protein
LCEPSLGGEAGGVAILYGQTNFVWRSRPRFTLALPNIVSSRISSDVGGEGLLIWFGIVDVMRATERVVAWGARHFWELLSSGIG